MIREICNSSHRTQSPGFSEWWYFHFLDEGGRTINAVLHETDIFGIEKSPYISLSFLVNPGEQAHHSVPLKHVKIGKSGKFLVVPNGVVKEDKNSLAFSFFFNNAGIEGRIRKLSQPLIINKSVLYQDELGRKSHWVVQTPFGQFKGKLKANGTSKRIKGSIYQDHQWGDLPIQEFATDWIWGHFGNELISVIFFKILTRKGELINRAGIVGTNLFTSSTQVETEFLDTLANQKMPEEASSVAQIILDGGYYLSFQVEPKNLIRSRVDEQHNGFRASYLRWSSLAQYEAHNLKYKLNGITEYLRIR